MTNHNKLCITDANLTIDAALEQNIMPTPEQWLRVKAAIQNAVNGPLTNHNMTSQHSPVPNAHYIGVYPGDFEELMDALDFTANEDLDIV